MKSFWSSRETYRVERRRVVRRLVRILLIVWIVVTVVTLWVAARQYPSQSPAGPPHTQGFYLADL